MNTIPNFILNHNYLVQFFLKFRELRDLQCKVLVGET